MPRHHRSRLITVLFALFSLLFMHLAVAGYACPGYAAQVAQQSEMAGMPCAESMAESMAESVAMPMDADQPNLCQAHCEAEQQSADKYQPPAPVAIGQLPVSFTLQHTPLALLAGDPFPGHVPHLQRATAPPIAIRNCCFRI